MKRKIVNPDLLEERANCDFDKQEITQMIFPVEVLEYWKHYIADIKKHPELKTSHEFHNMTREEQIKDWWIKLNKMWSISPHNYFINVRSNFYCPHWFHPGNSPVLLNIGMFLSGLEKMGSEEQLAKWKEDATALRIHGCYAQTELGHGSNVQGIETTATLDMATDEWVVHTPTISASKFWPGELGQFATHALVFAKAFANGNPLGVQVFMIQIRDPQTHLSMPGIMCGDIGEKFGYKDKDNGWMIFNQARIPRTNQLSRIVYIDKEGNLELRGNPKIIYSTMVGIRAMLCINAGTALRRALLVSIRYAACRRQFKTEPGKKSERKILDYQAHMDKLGPSLADAFLMQVVGKLIVKMQEDMEADLAKNEFKTLDVLHHMTSGFKSIFTLMAYNQIDECRRACGGAGYSAASMLPQICADYSPSPTYEGDNTVLAQQTASYLKKQFKRIAKGRPSKGIFSYLNNIDSLVKETSHATTIEEFSSIEHLDKALAVRAAFSIKSTFARMQASKEHQQIQINELFTEDIINLNRYHMTYLGWVIFNDSVNKAKAENPKSKQIMLLLGRIYALKQLKENNAILYETGFFGKGVQRLLADSMHSLLAQLRPQMVPLVELDTDSNQDQTYLSCIGNEYGDIYETQLEWAMESRMNHKERPEYFEELILPFRQKRDTNRPGEKIVIPPAKL